jgi:uncharacterized protein (DUF2336 family)
LFVSIHLRERKLATRLKTNNAPLGAFVLFWFAERVGFEPTIRLLVYKLSRLARSTTLTPLRVNGT